MRGLLSTSAACSAAPGRRRQLLIVPAGVVAPRPAQQPDTDERVAVQQRDVPHQPSGAKQGCGCGRAVSSVAS